MTEKRYQYIRTKYRHYIQDVEKDGEWKESYRGTYDTFDLDKICDLLNALHKENEQLNSKILEVLSNLEEKEEWKWEDLLGALDKIAVIVGYQTEQLGKEYTGSYETDIEQLQKEYDELSKENEQLRKQLDETIEGLHKEITTSENAFEGLMNENKELKQQIHYLIVVCQNELDNKTLKQVMGSLGDVE